MRTDPRGACRMTSVLIDARSVRTMTCEGSRRIRVELARRVIRVRYRRAGSHETMEPQE